jgi:hypothetical protein
VWYKASSSYFQYLLPSWRASISSLQRFTLSSHHFYPSFCLSFHNVFTRQFLRKMWPIQLAFLLSIVCRIFRRSQWPSGLRRGSAAARLLGLRVRNPPGGMDVCLLWMLCVCQVEVSATDWSLVQRSPTDCGVPLCVITWKNNPLHLTWLGREMLDYERKKKVYSCPHLLYVMHHPFSLIQSS